MGNTVDIEDRWTEIAAEIDALRPWMDFIQEGIWKEAVPIIESLIKFKKFRDSIGKKQVA
jgi:hypothetical protein